MSAHARKFLRKDRKLRVVIDKHGVQNLKIRRDYFNLLAMAIVYQQLSGKAAGTIYGRFRRTCNGRVTPLAVSLLSPKTMRKCGLSRQKISYIRDLSKKFIRKEINPRKFHFQTDEDVLPE